MSRFTTKRRMVLAGAAVLVCAIGILYWSSTRSRAVALPASIPADPPLSSTVAPQSVVLETARTSVPAPEPAAGPPAPTKIPAQHEVVVRTHDSAGNPVCGVELKFIVLMPGAFSEKTEQLEQPIGVTNEAGSVSARFATPKLVEGVSNLLEGFIAKIPELSVVPEGSTRIKVFAFKNGLSKVNEEFVLDLSQGTHELTLTLSRGLSLFGKATYSDASPVAAARVTAGSSQGITDATGQFQGYDNCDGRKVRVPGISGFVAGQAVTLTVNSPRPEYETYRERFTFELTDAGHDVVLMPARRMSLTLRDCTTGEPIQGPDLSFWTYVWEPNKNLYGGISKEVKLAGSPMKDVELRLEQRKAELLMISVPGFIGCCLKLEQAARIDLDSAPTPIEACLQRVQDLCVEIRLEDGTPVGDLGLYVTINRFKKPWTTSISGRSGSRVEIGPSIRPNPHSPASTEPIETVELTRIQWAGESLQFGMLVDPEGTIAAPIPARDVFSGTLLEPISLIPSVGDGWDGTTPMKLSFTLVPPSR